MLGWKRWWRKRSSWRLKRDLIALACPDCLAMSWTLQRKLIDLACPDCLAFSLMCSAISSARLYTLTAKPPLGSLLFHHHIWLAVNSSLTSSESIILIPTISKLKPTKMKPTTTRQTQTQFSTVEIYLPGHKEQSNSGHPPALPPSHTLIIFSMCS